MTIKQALLGAALTSAAFAAVAADDAPLANYYDSTLIWQNQVTHATGRIWLNRDGKFYVFYNMGSQPKPPDANGPFQVEGRIGTYTLRGTPGAYKLCLWPSAPRTTLGAEKQHELFAESTCYALNLHQAGDVWNENNDTQGRNYKMWLVQGR